MRDHVPKTAKISLNFYDLTADKFGISAKLAGSPITG